MTTATRTTLSIDEGIARLRMDDGKVNALSTELIDEVDARLGEAEKAGAVVVLEGREGIFSAGFDLKTFQQGPGAGTHMVRRGAELVVRLLEFPRPVLAVCTGHAYPAGAFLMLASDSRIGTEGDFQIGMNEVAIGLTIPRFAVELGRSRLAPAGFTRILTAAMVPPNDALRFGYLDRVVPSGEREAAVVAEAERLRALDMPSFEGTKERVNAPLIATIRQAIAEELASQ